MVNFDALVRFRSLTCGKVELVAVQRTDDFSRSADAFGKRALAMRAAILRRKQPSVTLPKDRDFFTFDDVAPALAKWNIIDITQVDGL